MPPHGPPGEPPETDRLPLFPGTLLHFVTSPKCLNTFGGIRRGLVASWLPLPSPLCFFFRLLVATGFVLWLTVAGVWLTFFPHAPARSCLPTPCGQYCSYKVSALNFSSNCFCFVHRCSFGPTLFFSVAFFPSPLLVALLLLKFVFYGLAELDNKHGGGKTFPLLIYYYAGLLSLPLSLLLS